MFAQCMHEEHEKCPKIIRTSRYPAHCNCPCHSGKLIPKDPCKRCSGTGKYGPPNVLEGICIRCAGDGKEPENHKNKLKI